MVIFHNKVCPSDLTPALTRTYPKGLSVSMQSSLHWSEKSTSFSRLFIMEFTSWSLCGARKKSKELSLTSENEASPQRTVTANQTGRGSKYAQMTEWALAAVSLALLSLVEILAYPMINMSTLPSETFGPNREVMSSGGTADPTFHVTM